MDIRPTQFEEKYRTDWIIDLNRLLVFKLMDQLFFPPEESPEPEGDGAEPEGRKRSRPSLPRVNLNEPESLLKFSPELLSQTPQFQSFCRCSNCMLDIAAVALNEAPSAYHISPEFNLVATNPTPFLEKLRLGIFKGMRKVGQNPHHG